MRTSSLKLSSQVREQIGKSCVILDDVLTDVVCAKFALLALVDALSVKI